ncbi:LPXTG cell wall anchor domain-containing protein [Aeromicrobium sp. NPDC092404]|uniref:LPXTG cell wall anchor domain-containing protein n=1 Tax=Aeromicrobium sp. NPDC092404 TaxID=3154976 RepID=UPI0034383FE1
MFKLRLVAAAAIACAVTLLSSGAQAYPDCGISLTLNDSTLVGGKSFSFTADAGEVDCDWTVTYRGKTKTGSGTSISGSYSTPVVSKKTTTKITAACEHEISDASASSASASTVTPAFYSAERSAVLPAATTVCPVSANVTLLPEGVAPDDAEDDGALPDTGGSNIWLLVLGGALVVVGGSVTYVARRRHSAR